MLTDLTKNQFFDIRPMILVIGHAFEDLCTRNIRKTCLNIIDGISHEEIRYNIVHGDTCAFDARVASTDSPRGNNMPVSGCRSHGMTIPLNHPMFKRISTPPGSGA